MKIAILRVAAFDVIGERAAALRALRTALRRGAVEHFVRAFVDEGDRLVALVGEIRGEVVAGDDEIPLGFVDRILDAGGRKRESHGDPPPLPAVEPLSERELEVLSLAAHGLSNQRLARRLYISENTVKTHLKNVFAKLGVRNRTQALFEARRRSLIA